MRVGHDGDAQCLTARFVHPPRPGRVGEPVFFRQAVIAPHRQHGHGGHTGQCLQLRRSGRQQARVAAELVQHEAGQAGTQIGRQQLPGAVQVGEGAAAVDVGHQQAAELAAVAGPAGGVEVDVVVRRQVDLGRRAGAFDHDELVPRTQPRKTLPCSDGQVGAALAPGQGRQLCRHRALQHDLAGGIALGLEQHRVHVDAGDHARGQRLEVLRRADFPEAAARARHDAGVVAHVLRLEGRDIDALPRGPAAQRGRQQALAGAAAGAPDHQGARCLAGHGVVCG